MLKRYGFRAVPFFLWRFSAENGRGGMRQKKRRRKSGESPVFPGGNDEGNVPDIRTARPFLQPEGRPLFVFMRYFREKRFQNTGAGPRTYSFLRGRFSMAGKAPAVCPEGAGKTCVFLRGRCRTGLLRHGRLRAGFLCRPAEASKEAFFRSDSCGRRNISEWGLYRQKLEGLMESHAFHEAFASSLVSPTGFEPVLEA